MSIGYTVGRQVYQKMTDANDQARYIGKPLELPLPQPDSIAVAPTAVGDDQQ